MILSLLIFIIGAEILQVGSVAISWFSLKYVSTIEINLYFTSFITFIFQMINLATSIGFYLAAIRINYIVRRYKKEMTQNDIMFLIIIHIFLTVVPCYLVCIIADIKIFDVAILSVSLNIFVSSLIAIITSILSFRAYCNYLNKTVRLVNPKNISRFIQY